MWNHEGMREKERKREKRKDWREGGQPSVRAEWMRTHKKRQAVVMFDGKVFVWYKRQEMTAFVYCPISFLFGFGYICSRDTLARSHFSRNSFPNKAVIIWAVTPAGWLTGEELENLGYVVLIFSVNSCMLLITHW